MSSMFRGLFLLQSAIAFTALLPASRCRSVSTLSSWGKVPQFSSSIARKVATTSTTTMESTTSKTTTTLVFDSKVLAKSQTMDPATLTAYFSTWDCRRYFLSSGGTAKIQDVPWDDELKSSFYKLYGSNQQRLPQSVHAVESRIQFPGIQVHGTITIASRFTCHNNNEETKQQSCYYENFMIAEESSASGLAPLVWLYHKLVPPSMGRKEPSGTSLTKISLDVSKRFVIVDSIVSIQVKFPSFLVRILPMSQEKMEVQGSASVRRSVSSDIDKALRTLPEMVAKYGACANME
jgi:hypothetical protein